MKILVAGKGFIGSNIGRKLEEEGHEVSYLDRSTGDYQHDITEPFKIEDEFDVLVHTIGLPPGFNTEQEYREVMVKGTENLLDAVKADKVIYISALRAGEINHSFFRTKRESEEMVENSGIDYTIIRPSTVIGEGNKLLEMIKRTAPTRVFPNIKTWTQPIRIEDLAEMTADCLEEYEGEILNAAGPRKYQVGEMARQIYREQGYSCILLPFPTALAKIALEPEILPRPFFKENTVLLETENTTDENHAAEIVKLKPAF